MEQAVKMANEQLCSLGITSVYDASPRNNLDRWNLVQKWKEDGLLKIRVKLILGKAGFEEYMKFFPVAPRGAICPPIGGVKIIVDETTGQLAPSRSELKEMVLSIHRLGFQTVLHAIEGNAIMAACDAVEYAIKTFPRSDHRHRIEHCSVCSFDLAKRIASLGITVVTQPSFIYYGGDRYLKTVPDQDLRHLYPIATLIKNGIKVGGSSDCPVVPPNPLIGIYASTTRKTETGNLILAEEGISPKDAVRMYTDWAAYAGFEERVKGSITPGKWADLVILKGDPTRMSSVQRNDIEVQMTILGGEVVWNKLG